MNFRNKQIYYIPNLVNERNFSIDQYVVSEKEAMLHFSLNHISTSIKELVDQYPLSIERDEIEKFLNYQFDYAKKALVNPDYCYHYYGKKDDISQGIIVNLPSHPDLIPMKIITTEFHKKEPIFQERVNLVYDQEYGQYTLNQFVEVYKENGIVVQSSYHPNILKKVRKSIRY